MSRIVLDASVLLAVIHQEPGAEQLKPELLAEATVCTVNLAEVHAKLVSSGWPPEEAWEDARSAAGVIVPFESEHAKIAGNLITQTRPYGLSLGDRACLALAISSNAAVYTADRTWKNLKLGVRIHVIR